LLYSVTEQQQQQSLLVDINMAKGQGYGDTQTDEGVVVSPPSAPIMNNYMNGLSNGITDDAHLKKGHGQGQDHDQPRVKGSRSRRRRTRRTQDTSLIL